MLTIKRLRVVNFKGWQEQEFSFKRGVTVLAGKNNCGKSTILHALSFWGFCCHYLQSRSMFAEFLTDPKKEIELDLDNFSAFPLTSLVNMWNGDVISNKRLERNLFDDVKRLRSRRGNRIYVRLVWEVDFVDYFLEFSVRMSQAKIKISVEMNNISGTTRLPKIAYLNSTNSVIDKEVRLSAVDKRKYIGFGQSGLIVRNRIFDLSEQGFARLVNFSKSNFNVEILRPSYNDSIDRYITLNCLSHGRKPHDIITEGNGFIQCLNIYSLLVDDAFDLVLLDEPDVHMHYNVQVSLISDVINIENQVIIATHSVEVLAYVDAQSIMKVDVLKGVASYLAKDSDKEQLFNVMGREYFSVLERIKKRPYVIFVEAEFDEVVLKTFARKLGLRWPSEHEAVILHQASKHKERLQFHKGLRYQIKDLQTVSLVDRDDSPNFKSVTSGLLNKSDRIKEDGFFDCTWRRREIENYLVNPNVLLRALTEKDSSKSLGDVIEFFSGKSISMHNSKIDYRVSDCNSVLANENLKEMLCGHDSFEQSFSVSRYEICEAFKREEIPEDVIRFLGFIDDWLGGKKLADLRG